MTYYALNGKTVVPIEGGVLEWARLMGDSPRQIGDDQAGPGVRVSTVFLGIDHQFIDGRPPLLFETMIFGGPLDGSQKRYSTYDEALEGHRQALSSAVEAAHWPPP